MERSPEQILKLVCPRTQSFVLQFFLKMNSVLFLTKYHMRCYAAKYVILLLFFLSCTSFHAFDVIFIIHNK